MGQIAVVGAGGIGTAVAGFLARAGLETTLVGRSPAHIEAIRRDGLRIEFPDGSSERVDLAATVDPGTVGTHAHIVIATKAFDTASAAASARPLAGPETWITTVQNGLGNDALLAETFGADRVLPGLTTIGAERRAPGTVYVSDITARGDSVTHVGPPRVPGGDLAGALSLAVPMGAAGLPVAPSDRIDDEVWKKLAMAVMGPVSALLGTTVGDTWGHPDARLLLERLHDETVRVAHAVGVELDRDASWAHAVRTYGGTGRHYTSMATDVLHGRRTEIDAITGRVVEVAAGLGIDVPAAESVVHLLRVAEAAGVRGAPQPDRPA